MVGTEQAKRLRKIPTDELTGVLAADIDQAVSETYHSLRAGASTATLTEEQQAALNDAVWSKTKTNVIGNYYGLSDDSEVLQMRDADGNPVMDLDALVSQVLIGEDGKPITPEQLRMPSTLSVGVSGEAAQTLGSAFASGRRARYITTQIPDNETALEAFNWVRGAKAARPEQMARVRVPEAYPGINETRALFVGSAAQLQDY